MPRGKVKWFNNAKGYGFIIEDGCNDDLFAHFSSIQIEGYKTLKAGQTVTFDKKPSDKGVHAVNIVPDPADSDRIPAQHDTQTGDNRDGYSSRAANA
ncbi:MAG: cold shock domain-containing protein [Gammaproteobacteria bacterium]|uniref:Cold shock-like protein CspD n=1 Tax=Marinobacter litoralis TaxID=187981 RepID=A0A3M2RL11_9GAMM|nr:cold shock domain-containing protein [Marinobacter litoralis]MBR9870119.1 cold shock domain-containing protein [Gammaproteobacteria bacterium]RMJ06040.1 Cold shock-like protein CspD [Marinobacter litoralis]